VHRGLGHHHPFRRRRGPPPWWPEGEPWPPRHHPAHWKHRHPFFRLKLAAFFALALGLSSYGALTLLRTLWGAAANRGPPPFWAFGPLALIALALLFGRALRRVAQPLGDLVDAADGVAKGDLAARVRMRGPPWLRSVAEGFNSMASRLELQRQQRQELMADIAHELRTPLTVIQGRLEGMLDGVYPRDDRQLERTLEETCLLGRLIEDLRTLAHSESGTLTLQREPTDLRALLDECVAAFEPQAQSQGTQLVRAWPELLPTLMVDPLRIREVVSNLLSNALRHVPRGGEVRVEVQCQPDGGTQMKVQDNGPGIPPELLPRIFDRFVKGQRSTGSGLGLTIARNLIVAHGGEIFAESPPGEGTTVTVRLKPIAE